MGERQRAWVSMGEQEREIVGERLRAWVRESPAALMPPLGGDVHGGAPAYLSAPPPSAVPLVNLRTCPLPQFPLPPPPTPFHVLAALFLYAAPLPPAGLYVPPPKLAPPPLQFPLSEASQMCRYEWMRKALQVYIDGRQIKRAGQAEDEADR